MQYLLYNLITQGSLQKIKGKENSFPFLRYVLFFCFFNKLAVSLVELNSAAAE